ncbi:phage N-6-adenine-methyltransferase [Mycolicibacterium llatzerense]|uniref:phage N-6-adenine-methyltransferase n=1 Tax=Mycolicibacterium llatzerense TaxID=280871 RepID=UPI0021B5BCA3|nr:phage N-6-adenine-methyltransferase [Mycolicibacterium llatzerense]
MGTDVWLTPRNILDALGPFDLDPCAAPDPSIWPTAAEHITLPQDGLCQLWHGRVWLNPPYNQAAQWLERLALHGQGTALIFARTETAGFVEHVWNAATAILFLHGRLHFHHGDGRRAKENSGAPSCLVAYGDSDAEALAESGLDGTYFENWRRPLRNRLANQATA